jgi:hypothetical protein
VETGNGRTEDSGGLTRNEENVIRLPRDWLGPPEELVPIGPAARARAAQRDLENGMPPAADAFWSEDSAALHDAVQAPPGDSGERRDPPAGLVPPVAARLTPRRKRLPRLRSVRGGTRVSRWWSLVAVPVAALVVAAVIGSTEGPASHPAASRASASHPAAARVTSTPQATSSTAGTERFQAQVKQRQQRAAARGRAHTRAQRSRPVKTHHRAPAHRSAGSPPPTVTEAAAAPSPSHSIAPSFTSTTPTAATASARSSGGSKPATGSAGPSGIGSVSGGCNPKCS